jgi:hypothetical protein
MGLRRFPQLRSAKVPDILAQHCCNLSPAHGSKPPDRKKSGWRCLLMERLKERLPVNLPGKLYMETLPDQLFTEKSI